MARRSPASIVDSYATMPLRQASNEQQHRHQQPVQPPRSFTGFTYRSQNSAAALDPVPAAPAAPAAPSAAPSVVSSSGSASTTTSTASQSFLLADMDGRSVKDNRACASCISKLQPHEVSQINWHLDQDDDCRLCQIAATKPEAFTQPFCDFLRENPTVFHTVAYCKSKLHAAGYKEVREYN